MYFVYPSLYSLCVCVTQFHNLLPHVFCPGTRICTSSLAGKTTKMPYYPTQSSGSNIIFIKYEEYSDFSSEYIIKSTIVIGSTCIGIRILILMVFSFRLF